MNDGRKTTRSRPPITRRRAFTLVEMMVVMTMIVLIASTILPSIFALFTAGADAQAYNVIAATLSVARTEAIQNGTYVAVHFQKADPTLNPQEADVFWLAVFKYDAPSGRFLLMDGHKPVSMPGKIAFGEINNNFVVAGTSTFDLDDSNANKSFANFSTFTIIFSPSGSIVKSVNGFAPQFDTSATALIFAGGADQRLWGPNYSTLSEAGATALTIFDYQQYMKSGNQANANNYLTQYGQLIPINVYTGQLLPRK